MAIWIEKHGWRLAGWALALLLLLSPALAMNFTAEVQWSLADFFVFGMLLLTAGLAIELVMQTIAQASTRWLGIIVILGLFVAAWALLAVGFD